jgi:galactokinase
VISENERTLAAAAAMQAGDAVELGRLMDASHVSMRDDFEISGPALNIMVACAQEEPGCYGARMTGGGFAGCAVALVQADLAQAFAANVAARYAARANLVPALYVSSASAGASVFAPLSD